MQETFQECNVCEGIIKCLLCLGGEHKFVVHYVVQPDMCCHSAYCMLNCASRGLKKLGCVGVFLYYLNQVVMINWSGNTLTLPSMDF